MSLKTCMFLYVNYVHFGMTYMHYNTPSRTKHRNNVHTLPSCIRQDQAYRNALLHTSELHSPRSGIPKCIIFRTEPQEEAIGRCDKSNVFIVWYLYQSFRGQRADIIGILA